MEDGSTKLQTMSTSISGTLGLSCKATDRLFYKTNAHAGLIQVALEDLADFTMPELTARLRASSSGPPIDGLYTIPGAALRLTS